MDGNCYREMLAVAQKRLDSLEEEAQALRSLIDALRTLIAIKPDAPAGQTPAAAEILEDLEDRGLSTAGEVAGRLDADVEAVRLALFELRKAGKVVRRRRRDPTGTRPVVWRLPRPGEASAPPPDGEGAGQT
ncbi:MAG: hypothetical protein OXG37_07460 [Actinomycetia bacterium]|nr:hypothetical protein [Actinomycetes bacterium]